MDQRRYEPQYNLQPGNTLYGYADPRYIPPAVSPEPLFKQYAQPFYPERGIPPHDPAYNTTRPKEGQREYKAEPYMAKKFDYHMDDRFHRARPQQEHYDRSPRQEYQQHYDRSPRRDYQGFDRPQLPEYNQDYDRPQRHNQGPNYQDYDRSPRHDYMESPRQRQHEDRYGHHEESRRHGQHEFQQRHGYHEDEYKHHQQQDVVPPAGRANSYSTRITDLLTSIREPQPKDETLEKMMETNKGYLVVMRFNQRDLNEVITAVQNNVSTITSHNGYVIGFATPDRIEVLIANNEMLALGMKKLDWNDSAICCFWFKDLGQAKTWFDSSNPLKQPDFPNSRQYQVVCVPLTYGRNKEPMPFTPTDDHPITILWCEFPKIYERVPHDFLNNYSDPARSRMKEYGASPHISLSTYKAGWPEMPNKYGSPGYARDFVVHERFARTPKTCWVAPESFITVSTFPSMAALRGFFYDTLYQREYRYRLDNYSNPVFVAITLTPVKGTKPRV